MPALTFDLSLGPYQDNGASPWYAPIDVGSQRTRMKLSLDTGTNMNWVTSTLCMTHACTLPGRVRFDPSASSSFSWVDRTETKLDYGPWGTLDAEIGKDKLHHAGLDSAGDVTMGLAVRYNGEKFDEVDWDGCVAMPAQGPMQHGMSFVAEDLRNAGILAENQCYITQYTDPATGTGECSIGTVDFSKADLSSMLVMRFEEYTEVVKRRKVPIRYIWTTPLTSATFAGKTIASDASFCLDTGSSRFKGDGRFMNAILGLAAQNPNAVLELKPESGRDTTLVVPPEIYTHKIDKGDKAGQTLPQFKELGGVANLFLAGSILMDHLYVAYIYGQGRDATGRITLKAQGMVAFNRAGGPEIIQNGRSHDGEPENFHADMLGLLTKGDSE